jgi:excisionase family DNA binding protein
MNEYYTVAEASEILGISTRTVLNWIHEGKLEAEKNGKTWHIYTDIAEFSKNTETDSETIAILLEQVQNLHQQNNDLMGQNSELIRQLSEMSERSDTIIMQLTKQVEKQTFLLEDRRNRSLWRRFKGALGFRDGRVDRAEYSH